MALRARALGLASGVLIGSLLFLMAVYSVMSGGRGELVGEFTIFFPGYTNTIGGAFFGLISGFIEGFIGGALLAWLYNRFHKLLYKPQAAQ